MAEALASAILRCCNPPWPCPKLRSVDITRNHPFVDGNKRVGAATALVFLELKDIEVRATEDALVETVLAVAQGKIGKAALAEFFRSHSRH